MSHTLHVRLKKAEGALVRLLGQIGRRGYEVLGVRADLSADGKTFDVLVTFEPFMPVPPALQQPRPAEVLPSLVAKLVEVESVELRSASPATKPAAPAPKGKAAAGKAEDMHFVDNE